MRLSIPPQSKKSTTYSTLILHRVLRPTNGWNFFSVLVQACEDAHCLLEELPTPQGVVDFMLEQKGLSRPDLAKWLGGKSRVADFFHGVRPLSLRQIAALREYLGIPADLLIGKKLDPADGVKSPLG
jgi:antitoxin component HigA of HigAB toxin-antitoxin module